MSETKLRVTLNPDGSSFIETTLPSGDVQTAMTHPDGDHSVKVTDAAGNARTVPTISDSEAGTFDVTTLTVDPITGLAHVEHSHTGSVDVDPLAGFGHEVIAIDDVGPGEDPLGQVPDVDPFGPQPAGPFDVDVAPGEGAIDLHPF